MTELADVVVIGAGIAGASAAYFAAEAGLKVVVVDTASSAAGCTGRSAANIRCHQTHPFEASLALEARELFTNWGDIVGGSCGFHQTGGLFIVGPEEADQLRRNVEMLRGVGIDTVALDGDQLRDLQPFMATGDVGAAAYEPESGYADGSLAVASMLDYAKERGAAFYFNCLTVHLVGTSDSVHGVLAGEDEISAPMVVLAAGAGSRALAREVDLDLPVYPYPIGAGSLRRPPSVGPPMAVIDRAVGLWYRADIDDLMLVEAGFQGLDLTDTDLLERYANPASPTRDELTGVAAKLRTRIPGLAEATLGRTWAAVDSCTPDGHAIVGPATNVRGLFLLTGANGLFIRFAPPFARRLIAQMTNAATADDSLAPYSLDRFTSGKTIHSEYEYGLSYRGDALPWSFS